MVILSFLLASAGSAAGPEDHAKHGAKQPSKPAQARPTRTDEPRAPIEVPTEQQSRMGIRTAAVEMKAVEHTIRTVGVVNADQTSEAHVHTRINGWIDRIYADYIGKPVKKGQPLFDLYSPDLVSTQQEYVAAAKQGSVGRDIAKAALERLRSWEVPQSEIKRLQDTKKPSRTVTFDSPVDGYVVNKTAIQGMYITPEMELYHIADLTHVWVIVTLYESDIATISVGEEAEITLPYDPNKTFRAKIGYIYPEIDPETRTAKARIILPNAGQALKPGMFANVTLKKDLGSSVVVPDDAVIDTGMRRLVFVKSGATRFEPKEIRVGPRVGEEFVVLQGLAAGDVVVTSAHFLIDAESKFQAAIQKGSPTGQSGHAGH
jgi:membrane fusion protein, copper/silver efflux system